MVFEWDTKKNLENINKHGVSFKAAQQAFLDPKRIIKLDVLHSTKNEIRYFCLGKVKTKVLTVRFTVRKKTIRIFGAGYWRTGKKQYLAENREKRSGNGKKKK